MEMAPLPVRGTDGKNIDGLVRRGDYDCCRSPSHERNRSARHGNGGCTEVRGRTKPKTGNFFTDLGLNGAAINDTRGRARGIWVLWDQSRVNFSLLDNNFQVIQQDSRNGFFRQFMRSQVGFFGMIYGII